MAAVLLNELALRRLLEDPIGPVGRDLRRRAENVTAQATENASGAIVRIQTGDLHSGIRFTIDRDAQGLRAIIGSSAQHDGFAYPGWLDTHGWPWLSKALERFRN